MIYFIFGEDLFRAREALNNIESAFVGKYGDLNVDKLDGDQTKKGLLEAKVQATPFLSDRRLVIIQNLLIDGIKEAKVAAEKLLEAVPESTVLIFFEEGSPDKRESLFKKLSKLPQCQEYDPLDPIKLKKWIIDRVEKSDFKITPDACGKLILYVGADLFRLNNELLIAENFAKSQNRHQIEIGDIEKFVEPNNAFKIFDLTDAIAQRNAQNAIKVLYSFKKSGEDEYRIFNLIVHQLRTMLMIEELIGNMSAENIARETKLHPFVVKKNMVNIKKFPQGRLKQMYADLENSDFKVKNGQIDIAAALELLIVDFCQR